MIREAPIGMLYQAYVERITSVNLKKLLAFLQEQITIRRENADTLSKLAEQVEKELANEI